MILYIYTLVKATEAAEDLAKLKADLVHLQSSSELGEEIMRKLDSSII